MLSSRNKKQTTKNVADTTFKLSRSRVESLNSVMVLSLYLNLAVTFFIIRYLYEWLYMSDIFYLLIMTYVLMSSIGVFRTCHISKLEFAAKVVNSFE